jgi:cation transport regulator ChaB
MSASKSAALVVVNDWDRTAGAPADTTAQPIAGYYSWRRTTSPAPRIVTHPNHKGVAKMPTRKSMPSTVKRSSAKAQRTYRKVHKNAVKQYGEGERAHRTALSALKRGFEKKGDHWVEKGHRGPSDPRSKRKSTAAKRAGRGETYGGVDLYGNTKHDLYERAKKLDISGRSKMSKKELARAIAKQN